MLMSTVFMLTTVMAINHEGRWGCAKNASTVSRGYPYHE